MKIDPNDTYGFSVGDRVVRPLIGEGIVKDIVIKELNKNEWLSVLVLQFDNELIIELPACNYKYIGVEKLD